jgi:outer membrane biosynthesis protein TonB
LARASVAVIASASLMFFAACGDSKSDDVTLSTDTALGRDLAMASADSNAQPKLQDVPVTPPPEPPPAVVEKAPAPKPKPVAAAPKPAAPPAAAPVTVPSPVPAPPPAPKTGSIEAGTSLTFAANNKICTNTTPQGEKFTAQLSHAVSGSNGAVIPAGATGTFEVTRSKTAKNSGDSAVLTVRLIAVTYDGNTYPVQATVESAPTTRTRSASKTTDAKKVGAGAAVGAIIGQIISKDTKGTVIGGVAGAAAGTAAAVATADYDACLGSGVPIAVKLDEPLTVKLGAAN